MASEWRKSSTGGQVLWDKGYTFGCVNAAQNGRYEAELFTGRSGSIGLKTFSDVSAAKAYVERATAAKRDAQAVRAEDALRPVGDAASLAAEQAEARRVAAQQKRAKYWASLEDLPAKTITPAKAKKLMTAKDSARRARLHRALDAVMDAK